MKKRLVGFSFILLLSSVLTGQKSIADEEVLGGTCFFVDSLGTAVTNLHVVERAASIEVVAADGTRSLAKVVKSSSILDIAVLATEIKTPKWLALAPNNSLTLGQNVFTIGFPATNILGDAPKYSEGTISSLRGLHNDESWIQISTPIQPGNSGGPLVDQSGDVVGVVTATVAFEKFFSETGSLPQNVNWAIKADYVRPMIKSNPRVYKSRNKLQIIADTEKSICRVITLREKKKANPVKVDPPGDFLGDQEGGFFLSVGSFRSMADADQLKSHLALLGFQARIQVVTVDDIRWNRVRFGPFKNLDSANDLRQILLENGIESLVRKVEP